ncbi:hypothetical protein D9M70_593290 [compost metagenome]
MRGHYPNPALELAVGVLGRKERHVHAQPVILSEIERAHDGTFAILLVIEARSGNMGDRGEKRLDMYQRLQCLWQIREWR